MSASAGHSAIAENGLPSARKRRPTWTFDQVEGLRVFGDWIVVRPDVDPDAEPVTMVGTDAQGREVHSIGGRELIVARDPHDRDALPEPTITGVVIGVGPGRMIPNPLIALLGPADENGNARTTYAYEPMAVTVGQHVAHSKYGVTEIEIAGEVLVMIQEKELRLDLPCAPEDIQVPGADGDE